MIGQVLRIVSMKTTDLENYAVRNKRGRILIHFQYRPSARALGIHLFCTWKLVAHCWVIVKEDSR